MSALSRLFPALILVLAPLSAGPPPTPMAANHAMQFQMQMQMQMQMSRARFAALQAQRRRANEQVARQKNAIQTDELAKPAGEAWRIPLSPGGNRGDDASVVVAVGEKWLIARSRDKGADLWSSAMEGGFESGPVVSNGLVLYATSDYRCVALEKDSGKQRYQVQLESLRRFFSADNNKTKVQFPIIEGKRVYLATYGKGADGEAGGKLYALDLDTGAKLWEAGLAAGADHPPMVLGDRILVGGAPWIQAFQTSDGKPLWKTHLGSSKWVSMGVEAQGHYCLTADKTVLALDMAKGEVLWRQEVGSALTGDDRQLFSLRVGMFGGATLVALDPATGRPTWERKGVGTLPWTQDGRAYVAEEGALRCLDVMDGKQVWEWPMAKPSPWPAMMVGSQLVVACPDGKTTVLRYLDPATGKETWSITVKAKPGSGLLVADGAGILFPGKDDEMICLK
ncbi:MAG: PQQ-binding-like beta-propeller repeat protein [Holophagaceae bacterium]|uniref:PQQ-binding-like beta-propeller repeat protein n=1 Tax=Candidatus Geothrix skivensis TaxID=2954439 RepID=A0A9D7SHF1_9BACT|nr:PQQ-binding-like beta-propeller repeat protein [Candidatus Geothrix skivensis]